MRERAIFTQRKMLEGSSFRRWCNNIKATGPSKVSKPLPNRKVWTMRFAAARGKYLPLSRRAPEAETHGQRLLSCLQVFAGTRQTAQGRFIFHLPVTCLRHPINTKCSNGVHTLRRKSAGLTLGTRGKGGTEKSGFQEGKRPTIIGAEQ